MLPASEFQLRHNMAPHLARKTRLAILDFFPGQAIVLRSN